MARTQLSVRDLIGPLRRRHRRGRHLLHRRRRRVRLPARPVRLRQDHDAALHRRPRDAATPARSPSAASRVRRGAGITCRPNERGIGMVFQSYAIWPHMTVFENVAFPLRDRAAPPPRRNPRTRRRGAAPVGLDGFRAALRRPNSPAASSSASPSPAPMVTEPRAAAVRRAAEQPRCRPARAACGSTERCSAGSADLASMSPTTRPRRW